MGSWFSLELDTTAPSLSIHAPYYTLSGIPVPVQIEASEDILEYSVYTIDSKGVRTDYILSVANNILYGTLINLNTPGLLKIRASVTDSVLNRSTEVEKTIIVIDTYDLTKYLVYIQIEQPEVEANYTKTSILASITTPFVESEVNIQ